VVETGYGVQQRAGLGVEAAVGAQLVFEFLDLGEQAVAHGDRLGLALHDQLLAVRSPVPCHLAFRGGDAGGGRR